MILAPILFRFRFRLFHFFQRIIYACIAGVGVAKHHLLALVTGEALDSPGVGTGFRQIGNRGVSHRVRNDIGWVQARPDDAATVRLLHAVNVARSRRQVRENPSVLVIGHFSFAQQDIRDFACQRLVAELSSLYTNAQP